MTTYPEPVDALRRRMRMRKRRKRKTRRRRKEEEKEVIVVVGRVWQGRRNRYSSLSCQPAGRSFDFTDPREQSPRVAKLMLASSTLTGVVESTCSRLNALSPRIFVMATAPCTFGKSKNPGVVSILSLSRSRQVFRVSRNYGFTCGLVNV